MEGWRRKKWFGRGEGGKAAAAEFPREREGGQFLPAIPEQRAAKLFGNKLSKNHLLFHILLIYSDLEVRVKQKVDKFKGN